MNVEINKEIPLISFCVPTYNRCNRVLECLQSILKVDYPYIEVIVSDNHSKDDTEEKIRELYSNNKKVTYFRNSENIGFTKNFLSFLNKANGKYLFYISDEDKLNSEFVDSTLVPFLTSNEPNLAFSSLQRDSEMYVLKEDQFFDDPLKAIKRNIFSNNYISGYIINKNILDHDSILKITNSNPDFVYPQELIVIELLKKGKLATFSQPSIYMGAKEDKVILDEEIIFNHPQERAKQIRVLYNFVIQNNDNLIIQKAMLKELAIRAADITIYWHFKQYGIKARREYFNNINQLSRLSSIFKRSLMIKRIYSFGSKIKNKIL